MDAKKIVLLVGALIVAAITAVMARSMFAGSAAPTAAAAPVSNIPVEGPEVLVAKRALPIGTIIDPESFTFQRWPAELVEGNNYFIKSQGADIAKLQGRVVRFAITAGQPVTQGALVAPGDRGFLAAALGPGMRAVTVSVSAQSGVAGFVFPGDRIDLVLSQSVTGGGEGPPLKVSETFVRNLRVLATDQRVSAEDEEGRRNVVTFSTVTLEATPRIAEKIAVAQTVGQLSLSLRSIADNNAELERAIASGEVSVPEGDDPKADKQFLLAVAARPVDTDTTFVTGADVSRFQRSSVPAKSAPGGGMSMMSQPAAAPVQGSTPAPAATRGPTVTVVRGNAVTDTPVGGK